VVGWMLSYQHTGCHTQITSGARPISRRQNHMQVHNQSIPLLQYAWAAWLTGREGAEMLSTLLSELGVRGLDGDEINLWMELQPDQICGNEPHPSDCTCIACSSMPKEEKS
jgi:hypothetical protein